VPVQSVSKFFAQDSSRSHPISSDKIKSDPDLSEGSEQQKKSLLQRVPSVAIYTLAAFVAQDLAHQALATAQDVGITNQPTIKQSSDLDVATTREKLTSKEARSIASPELVSQEFSQNTLAASNSNTPIVVPAASSLTPTAIAPPEAEIKPASTNFATKLVNVQTNSAQDLANIASPKLLKTSKEVLAQVQPSTTKPCLEVDGLRTQLRDLEKIKKVDEFQASPGLSIAIPTGFGADNNTGFVSATYQNRTRFSNVSDGAVGVGIGLGDARKSVGVELSYTAASFGGSRDFGGGGFNAKIHRQIADDLAVAAGWNGFVNVGGRNDFENSVYGTVTKIFRTRDEINSPFSRVAVTAGIGNGQFRSENAVAKGSGGVNVFGNVAVRVAQPVSLIAEWSGQDLGVGVSFVPFKNIPLVITPAVRDITGAGDGPRFVLGTGFAFKF
jgi:hypothetical protein